MVVFIMIHDGAYNGDYEICPPIWFLNLVPSEIARLFNVGALH